MSIQPIQYIYIILLLYYINNNNNLQGFVSRQKACTIHAYSGLLTTPMKTLILKLDDHTHSKFKVACYQKGATMTAVVQEAIIRYIRMVDREEANSRDSRTAIARYRPVLDWEQD